MGVNSIIFRRFLLRRQFSNLNSSNLVETLISPSTSPSANIVIPKLPLFRNYISTSSSEKFPCLQFTLYSSPDGPFDIVLIKSGEEFNSSLGKVKGNLYPAGRLISPVVEQLSAKYPHIMIYKIDIDQEGLESTLSKLNISAVPTLLFFENGEKAAEVVGADVSILKTTMEELYKKD